jgi:hypothetical protein
MMGYRTLVRVIAPDFVAGLLFADGECIGTAPAFPEAWKGKSEVACWQMLDLRGWQASVVDGYWEDKH